MKGIRKILVVVFFISLPSNLGYTAELKVLLSGAGDGMVVGDEIGCPMICHKTFTGQLVIHLTSILQKDLSKADMKDLDLDLPLEAHEMTLKAVPYEWATFSGWHVNGIVPSESTLTIEHDTILKATFQLPDLIHEFVLYWYRDGHRDYALVALDELELMLHIPWSFDQLGEKERRQFLTDFQTYFHTQVEITWTSGTWVRIKSPELLTKEQWLTAYNALKTLPYILAVQPVFYDDMTRRSEVYIFGQISVQYLQRYTEEQIQEIEQEYGLVRKDVRIQEVTTVLKETSYTYDLGDPLKAIEVANQLYESGRVEYASPEIAPNVAIM
jgi:hypothetical protein